MAQTQAFPPTSVLPQGCRRDRSPPVREATLLSQAAAVLASLALPALASAAIASGGEAASLERLQARLGTLTVPWVANAGQWDERAAWQARSFAGAVWLARDGTLVHQFNGPRAHECHDRAWRMWPSAAERAHLCERAGGWVLTERFLGGHVGLVEGREVQRGRVSYLTGKATHHAEGLSSYGALSLGEVYPGVEVELRAREGNIEKLYTVAPGRDAGVIRMRLAGVERVQLTEDGALEAQTGHGPIRFTPPVAFQYDRRNERQAVTVSYALAANACGRDCHEYGFALGRYDRSRPLVIDPLLQSTYVGGSGAEVARAIAIHPVSGEVYVAGATSSTGFPGTSGGAQPGSGGGFDAFVARFNAALTVRHQSTYLGNAGVDEANALAIHPATGEIYVAGYTASNPFPGTAGGAQVAYGGGTYDAFVARFDAALTTLHQSTYVGGSGDDQAYALAIHPASGEIYVAGATSSTSFPGTGGGAQAASGGGEDAFVTRFNAALTVRHQSTYLGGSGGDAAYALAIHPLSGEVYAAGQTTSSDVPGTAGGAQPVSGGGAYDAIAARFNAALTVRHQSTYLGGSGSDIAYALAVHPASGQVYVAGATTSTSFPGTAGGAQPTAGGGDDAFLARLDASLGVRYQSTYLGGVGSDIAFTLAIHSISGEVYTAGATNSPTFPGTAGGTQATSGGGFDAFVARFNAALTVRHQSTYLGGTGADRAYALALSLASGEIYVAGQTTFVGFPGTTGGAQATSGGSSDAFASRFSLDLRAGDVVPDPFVLPAQFGVPVSSLRSAGPVRVTGLAAPAPVTVDGALGSAVCVSTSNTCSCDSSAGWVVSASIADNQYLCVRHVSAPTAETYSESRVVAGGFAAKFISFTANISACSLDMDDDGLVTAPKEGLVIARALLGLAPAAAVAGTGITEAQWDAKRTALATCGMVF